MFEEKPVILFVDDKPTTHRYFREQMQKVNDYQQYEIILALDLEEAIDVLDSLAKRTIAAVIIDLQLPGEVPVRLRKAYQQQYQGKIQLNEGQILGMYLRDKHPNLNYFYMSAYQEKCKQELEGIRKPLVINKEADWDKFKNTLDQVISENIEIKTNKHL